MLVVSNLVPSYPEKEGLKLLTDLEFHQMVEKSKDAFIEIVEPSRAVGIFSDPWE